MKYLAEVGGRPIWRGEASHAVIAPAGEQRDEAILVEDPTRSAFEQMIANAGYQSGLYLRTAISMIRGGSRQ
jgi:uncharacterized protein (DUF1330 family)